jgi:hypothetical protein
MTYAEILALSLCRKIVEDDECGDGFRLSLTDPEDHDCPDFDKMRRANDIIALLEKRKEMMGE